jgi:hypothetical protein
MKLRELRKYIVGPVVVYQEKSEVEFEDIYEGLLKNAPEELLRREVRVIGAKSRNVLDIEVLP